MSVDVTSGVVKRVSGNQYVVRMVERSYQRGAVEVMVDPELVRRFRIVEGAGVVGEVERKKGRATLVSIESIGGMKPEDFATFGMTQRTLSQFLHGGWAALDVS